MVDPESSVSTRPARPRRRKLAQPGAVTTSAIANVFNGALGVVEELGELDWGDDVWFEGRLLEKANASLSTSTLYSRVHVGQAAIQVSFASSSP